MRQFIRDKKSFLVRLGLGSNSTLLVGYKSTGLLRDWQQALGEKADFFNLSGLGALQLPKERYDAIFVCPELVLFDEAALIDYLLKMLRPDGVLYFVCDTFERSLIEVNRERWGIFGRLLARWAHLPEELEGRVSLWRFLTTVKFLNLFNGSCRFRVCPIIWVLPGARYLAVLAGSVISPQYKQKFRFLKKIVKTAASPNPTDFVWCVTDSNIDKILRANNSLELGSSDVGFLMAARSLPQRTALSDNRYISEKMIWKVKDKNYVDLLGAPTPTTEEIAEKLVAVNQQYPFIESDPNERLSALLEVYYEIYYSPTLSVNVSSDCSNSSLITAAIVVASQRAGGEEGLYKKLEYSLLGNCSNEIERFETVYKFIQNSFFHHPFMQTDISDSGYNGKAMALLFGGIGRCGVISRVADWVYQKMGFESRVRQLASHLCLEVKVEDKWRVVDCDVLKSGLYPKDKAGNWASLDDAFRDPDLLDRVHSVGLQLSPSRWGLNKFGDLIRGYVDTGLAWDRPYLSGLYFGQDLTPPPRPPDLKLDFRPGKGVDITFRDIHPATRALRLSVGTRSRGWSYQDIPSGAYTGTISQDVYEETVQTGRFSEPIFLDLKTTKADAIFINVEAFDHRALADRDIVVWPGEEINIDKELSHIG